MSVHFDVYICIYAFPVWPPPSSCVEVLLAAGAAVDLTAAGGQTPLFLACEAGKPDCARVLLSAGADRSRTTAVSLLFKVFLFCGLR